MSLRPGGGAAIRSWAIDRVVALGHRTVLPYLILMAVGTTPAQHIVGARDAAAQGLWTEASTVGYAALGLGVAFAAVSDDDCSGCTIRAGIGIVAGGLGFGLGNLIGSSAESRARLGQRPDARQLLGVRIGTVLAGASLGALVGGVYINRKGIKNPGGDERDLAILTVLGAGAGAWIEYRQEAWLRVAGGNVEPMVRRSRDGRTELGIALSLPR